MFAVMVGHFLGIPNLLHDFYNVGDFIWRCFFKDTKEEFTDVDNYFH